MANSVRRIETSDLTLAIAFIVPLFFFVPAADTFNLPKLWIFLVLSIGLMVHFLLGGRKQVVESIKGTRYLSVFLILFSAVMTWAAFASESTIPRILSGYPGRSNGLLFYLGVFILVWVSSNTNLSSDFPRSMRRALILLFVTFSLYSFVQLIGLDPVDWSNPYNPVIGTLGNPNFSGAFLGVAAIATLQIARTGLRREKIKYTLLGLVLLALATSTGSLQAIGIFFIGVVLLGLVLLHEKFGLKPMLWALGAFSILGTFVFGSFLGLGPLGDKLLQYTLQLRLEYWRVGLEIAEAFPLTGIGPDSYVEGFRLFRGDEFVRKYSDQVISDSAHNVLINFLANFGIPAFVFLLCLVLAISMRAVSVLFSKEKNSTEFKMVSLIWLLLLIQSMFSLEQIGLSVLQWTCGGLLLNSQILEFRAQGESDGRQKTKQRPIQESRSFLVGLRSELTVLSVVLSAIVTWGYVQQEVEIRRVAQTDIKPSESEMIIQNQLSKFDLFTMHETKRLVYVNIYLLSAERYDNTEAFLDNLLKVDPDDMYVREQLARLASFRGDVSKEIKFRQEIEQIDPSNYTNLLSLATALSKTGFEVESKVYAKRVIELTTDKEMEEAALKIIE
jgi:O-antigen ligase